MSDQSRLASPGGDSDRDSSEPPPSLNSQRSAALHALPCSSERFPPFAQPDRPVPFLPAPLAPISLTACGNDTSDRSSAVMATNSRVLTTNSFQPC